MKSLEFKYKSRLERCKKKLRKFLFMKIITVSLCEIPFMCFFYFVERKESDGDRSKARARLE